MASFVAGSAYTNVASGALPLGIDVGGNGRSFGLFSHIRVIGAGTVTFDTGQVVTSVAGTDTVAAIPGNAANIVVGGGTPTVQLGQVV